MNSRYVIGGLEGCLPTSTPTRTLGLRASRSIDQHRSTPAPTTDERPGSWLESSERSTPRRVVAGPQASVDARGVGRDGSNRPTRNRGTRLRVTDLTGLSLVESRRPTTASPIWRPHDRGTCRAGRSSCSGPGRPRASFGKAVIEGEADPQMRCFEPSRVESVPPGHTIGRIHGCPYLGGSPARAHRPGGLRDGQRHPTAARRLLRTPPG